MRDFERHMRRTMKHVMQAKMRAARFGGGPFGEGGPYGEHGPFGEDGPFGPGGPRGPRGRRGRMFASGELRLVLLKLIAQQPRHGYDLIKAIEGMTGGSYAPSPGVVYPTLQMMLDEGLISEVPDESARKVFSIAQAGSAELEAQKETVDEVMERLAGVGEERLSSPNRQIHRAMENVRNALRHQRQAMKLQGEVVDKIVDVLDEAARKIDRL